MPGSISNAIAPMTFSPTKAFRDADGDNDGSVAPANSRPLNKPASIITISPAAQAILNGQ